VTATANGTIIASIPAGNVADPDAYLNNASTSTDGTVTFDASVPLVTLFSPLDGATITDVTTDLTVTFNKAVNTVS